MSTEEVGYAKLSNNLVSRGILAHLPGDTFKIFAALLLAGRRDTGTSFLTIKTLCRWSGVSRHKLPKAMAFLIEHKLVERFKIQMGSKPRRLYRLVSPDMMPDYRTTCEICNKKPDDRVTCVREEGTGRLLGRPKREQKPDDRVMHMKPDDRATNHSEPLLIIRETEPDGAARSAPPPQGAASLTAPGNGNGNDPPKDPGPLDRELAAVIERAHAAHSRMNAKDEGDGDGTR